jgi:hypothetical protein
MVPEHGSNLNALLLIGSIRFSGIGRQEASALI